MWETSQQLRKSVWCRLDSRFVTVTHCFGGSESPRPVTNQLETCLCGCHSGPAFPIYTGVFQSIPAQSEEGPSGRKKLLQAAYMPVRPKAIFLKDTESVLQP